MGEHISRHKIKHVLDLWEGLKFGLGFGLGLALSIGFVIVILYFLLGVTIDSMFFP